MAGAGGGARHKMAATTFLQSHSKDPHSVLAVAAVSKNLHRQSNLQGPVKKTLTHSFRSGVSRLNYFISGETEIS